jgi:hypothetical protein
VYSLCLSNQLFTYYSCGIKVPRIIVHPPKYVSMALIIGDNELPVGAWDSHVHVVDEVGLRFFDGFRSLTRAG